MFHHFRLDFSRQVLEELENQWAGILKLAREQWNVYISCMKRNKSEN